MWTTKQDIERTIINITDDWKVHYTAGCIFPTLEISRKNTLLKYK